MFCFRKYDDLVEQLEKLNQDYFNKVLFTNDKKIMAEYDKILDDIMTVIKNK